MPATVVGSGWLKIQYYLKKAGWEAEKAAGKHTELGFAYASLRLYQIPALGVAQGKSICLDMS